VIANESWTNQQVVNCRNLRSGSTFTGDMMAIQPNNSAQPLRYSRTLSIHNYLVVRFELIASNWTNSSALSISVLNQLSSDLMPAQTVPFFSNVPA
jgi:hypothetical protein